MAEEYRTVDYCRSVRPEPGENRVGSGQRLARNAVGAVRNQRLGRVREPTFFDTTLVNVTLYGFQLLTPIRGGVGQIFVDVGRSAPKFVRVRNIRSGERAQRRDDMEKDENGYRPSPTTIAAYQAPGGTARQYRNEEENQKDMPHSDVQTRSHRNTKIKCRRHRQKQNFAPAAQLARRDRVDDQRQKDQSGQRRLYDERDGEIKPNSMRIDLPEYVAGPRIRHRTNVCQSVEPRLRQNSVVRHHRDRFCFGRTKVLERVFQWWIHRHPCRTCRIAESVARPHDADDDDSRNDESTGEAGCLMQASLASGFATAQQFGNGKQNQH